MDKHTAIPGGVALAVLMALAGTGCSKSPVESPAEETGTAKAMLIVPHRSVGPIEAGMTVTQLVAVLGEPQRRTTRTLDYPKLGLAVMPDAEGIVHVIMAGDVTGINGPYVERFTGRTREGIGMRSDKEEVLRAYGPPNRTRGKPGGLESLRYDTLGITFTLQGGKVHHMIIVLGSEEPQEEPSIKLDLVPGLPPDAAPER